MLTTIAKQKSNNNELKGSPDYVNTYLCDIWRADRFDVACDGRRACANQRRAPAENVVVMVMCRRRVGAEIQQPFGALDAGVTRRYEQRRVESALDLCQLLLLLAALRVAAKTTEGEAAVAT